MKNSSKAAEEFLVSKWALIRRNELVDIPEKLEIHPDFLREISYEAFERAFREIGELFYRMYTDMANDPQKFGLPLYQAEEYDYFSPFSELCIHIKTGL